MRKHLRWGLGALWLVDGLLQLQPMMWTRDFGAGTLTSAGEGQPEVIGAPIRLFGRIVAAHPAPWNLCFAVAELVLGLGLLLARRPMAQRVLCAGSLAWAMGIWVLGEGFGGLLGGSAELSVGAPGAALLYVLLTAAAWPSQRPPARWLPTAWASIWLLGSLLQLLPSQITGVALGSQVEMASMMSPAVLARPELHVSLWLAGLPGVAAGVLAGGLAVGFAWIALAVFDDGRRRAALWTGVGVSVVFWILCQGFGGLSTGAATDPGSAPLMVLLAYAVAAVPVGESVPGRIRHLLPVRL